MIRGGHDAMDKRANPPKSRCITYFRDTACRNRPLCQLVLGEPGMCCAVEISVAPVVARGKNEKKVDENADGQRAGSRDSV